MSINTLTPAHADKPVYRLEGWSQRGQHLLGFAHGRKDTKDGEFIKTSRVISSCGNRVETKNSVYVLGEVDKDYAKMREEAKSPIDPECPVRVWNPSI